MSSKTTQDYIQEKQNLYSLATLQQRAAADPLHSVWVSASAGTGKTRVLSDRVLRMLLKNIDAAKILCLTYTKAAAVEMKNRIFERLSEWTILSESELTKNLANLLGDEIKNTADMEKIKQTARTRFAALLDTPGGIKIQTIHSFCQEILQRFPLEAEILPYFEIMEDREVDEVLHRLQNKLQLDAELSPTTLMSRALQYLNARMDEKSFPLIMQNIAQNRSEIATLLCRFSDIDAFAAALQKRLQIANPNISAQDLATAYMSAIDRQAVKNFLALWQTGKKVCDKKNSQQISEMLNRDFPLTDFESYTQIFSSQKIAGKDVLTTNPHFAAWIETEKERTNECLQKISHQKLYEATLNLMVVADEFISRYEEYKLCHGKMDYADLILVTKRLLQKSQMADWILYKLDGGIDHILVDEAQDTSPLQWDIIHTLAAEFLSGEGLKNSATVFAVGDRKQSIFSFQGADPDKYDAMAKKASSGSHFNKIDLAVSFRSAPAILETVNRLFAAPEIAAGVVSAGESVNHIASRVGEFGEVQIWPFMTKPEDAKTEKKAELEPLQQVKIVSLRQQMAEAITDEIERLIRESQNQKQPLKYSDFMVLVQRRSSIVTEFIRACKSRDIPITGADKLLLGREIAVQDLISLGKFLLLPEDDLSLAEVLKSPLFGLSDDDLTELCYNRGLLSVWQKLGQNKQYADTYNSLQTLLNKVDYIRPFELYNEVLSNMKGRYKMTLRMGMEVEDAIDEFMNLALTFEKENIPTLQGFIRWLEQTEVEIKRETDSKDLNAVRLMTVHRSKGLQAPVVFLADAGFTKEITHSQNLLLDDNVAYYPLSKDYYEENCNAVIEKQQKKLLEERKRLLYVALTRAEDRLYICGFQSSNSSKIPEDSWYDMCIKHFQDENGQPLDGKQLWQHNSPDIIAKQQQKNKGIILKRLPLPTWYNLPVNNEAATAKPYTPSKPQDDETEIDSISPLAAEGNYYRRGILIHKLLQFLPQTKGDKRQIISNYLQQYTSQITPGEQKNILYEVINLLEDENYQDIFGPHAQSEVPIMGEVDGKIISAQIDKLVILEDKVIIVDFKTNRPAAPDLETTPQVYKNQLATYAELLHRIYPKHTIEAYILWTNVPRLMRVI